MKVLMVSECPFAASSLGKIALHTARGLLSEGFDVVIACKALFPVMLHGDFMYFNAYKLSGGFFPPSFDVDIKMRGFVDARHLRAIYDQGRFDIMVIYGYTVGMGAEGIEAMKGRHDPVVAYLLYETRHPSYHMILSLLDLTQVALPTRYGASSVIEGLERIGVVEAHRRVSVVPHGLDPELYSPHRCTGQIEYDLLFISKNHVRKDFEAYINALVELSLEKGYRFIAAAYPMGDGPWHLQKFIEDATFRYRRRVRARIVEASEPLRKLGMSEPQLISVYCSSRNIVFATIGEAFGLVALEAALLAKPLAVTRLPVTEEIWGSVLDKRLFFECHWGKYIIGEPIELCRVDVGSLKESIEYMLENKEEMEEQGWKLREYAEKNYNDRVMVKTLVETIEKAVSDPTRIRNIAPPAR